MHATHAFILTAAVILAAQQLLIAILLRRIAPLRAKAREHESALKKASGHLHRLAYALDYATRNDRTRVDYVVANLLEKYLDTCSDGAPHREPDVRGQCPHCHRVPGGRLKRNG